MSYTVRFENSKGEICETPLHNFTGGTYQLGGSREAELNITYNYSKRLGEVLSGGIRSLYGLRSPEVIEKLDIVIAQLGNDIDLNCWKPTDGNIKTALMYLRRLAEFCPEGILHGD